MIFVSHFTCEFCFISKHYWYVKAGQYLVLTYKQIPQRKLHFEDQTVLSPLGAIVLSRSSVQGRVGPTFELQQLEHRPENSNLQLGAHLDMSGHNTHLRARFIQPETNETWVTAVQSKRKHHFEHPFRSCLKFTTH